MRLLFTTSLLFLGLVTKCLAQENITAAEYFIDEDPGVGAATAIPTIVEEGQLIDLQFTILTSTMDLSDGMHLLGIRIQDANGDWSHYETRTFIVQSDVGVSDPPAANINTLEYFVDEDPGVGNGNTITGSGRSVDLNEMISSVGLSDGFHVVGVRAQNTDLRWGFTEVRSFYIQDLDELDSSDPAKIQAIEYFIDEDPGHGNGVSISVSQSLMIDVEDMLSTTNFTNGFHTLSVRAMDENNRWGLAETRTFYIQNISTVNETATPIVAMEYFIDEDPGTGQGIPISVTEGQLVDITSIQLSLVDSYPVGTHTITIRAQNEDGKWGFGETMEFELDGDCPIAAFDMDKACVSETFTLTDQSTGIMGEATYRWYADDKLISDETDNVTHVFDSPGTHTFALAIKNGEVCTDSTGVEIIVKPQPFVTFSAASVVVGNATTYEVNQFNVDPEAIWSWDFDGDEVEDASTPGEASYTFPSTGTYTTTVIVSDNEGCETSFSKEVVVLPESVETPDDPNVLFSTDAGCVGVEATFENLSTNIPSGSAYAWDFDGDGNTDSADAGNVTFTYSNAGEYIAELTIITPDEDTFSATIDVNIQDAPTVDFDFTYDTDLDRSATARFINLSEGSGVDYLWDFNGEGTSSKVSPSFTFNDFVGKTFTVCLTAMNQCPEVTVCKELSFDITGIDSFEAYNIQLYPNPSDGQVSIRFPGRITDSYLIQVIDLAGKVYQRITVDQNEDGQIDLRSLESGTYLVTVRSENMWAREKLIVR
ncbi:MAG: hypothetical protein Tsb0034_04440 [Ekhidna sp.]